MFCSRRDIREELMYFIVRLSGADHRDSGAVPIRPRQFSADAVMTSWSEQVTGFAAQDEGEPWSGKTVKIGTVRAPTSGDCHHILRLF